MLKWKIEILWLVCINQTENMGVEAGIMASIVPSVWIIDGLSDEVTVLDSVSLTTLNVVVR